MDIEDIVSNSSSQVSNNAVRFGFIKKKINEDSPEPVGDNIPGTQRIFVQVWGCAHNFSDGEYMAGLLAAYGYKVTLGGGKDASADALEKAAADLWVLNSCTVKGPAEDHFRNAILSAQAAGKRIVVAGCVPQGSPDLAYLKDVSVVGVQQIDRVVEVVEQTLLGNVVRFMEKYVSQIDNGAEEDNSHTGQRRLRRTPLSLPKIRRNPFIEILAISTGCLNTCTYCKTKHARGVLASYTVEELVQRAVEAFREGVKELWLTSEDLGAYGRDLIRSEHSLVTTPPLVASRWSHHLTLADLLFALVPVIPAGCMLRLGMTNPPYILDQLQEVAAVLRHPRVFAFLHVPVQSGSNPVLHAMRREYTVEEFQNVVDFLEKEVHSVDGDKITVATDIICGFPSENACDFQATLQLVERYKFPVLFVNQFFARPGTPAASMKREATTAAVKKRTRTLHDLFRTYEPFAGRQGRRYRVLITEASTDGKYWVGHTKAYEQILLPKDSDLQGRMVLVEVTECHKFFMRGVIVDRGPFTSLSTDTVDDETPPLLLSAPLANLEKPSSGRNHNNVSRTKKRSSFLPFNPIPVTIILLIITWAMTKLLDIH